MDCAPAESGVDVTLACGCFTGTAADVWGAVVKGATAVDVVGGGTNWGGLFDLGALRLIGSAEDDAMEVGFVVVGV